MKHLFICLVSFLTVIFITGCNSTRSNSLPTSITALAFSYDTGYNPPESQREGLLSLSKANGLYSGTFTSSYGNPATSSCTLSINLTQAESQTFDSYLGVATYCSETPDGRLVDCAVKRVTVNGSLVISKEQTCGSATYNYLCSGGDDIYNYIKSIVGAHTDIATCPTTWDDTF